MGGIVKLAAAVIVIWAALEFYNEGVEGAFGGVFAPEISNPLERTASAPKRAKLATERALQATEERRNRLLGE
jgi:hypothetical protein